MPGPDPFAEMVREKYRFLRHRWSRFMGNAIDLHVKDDTRAEPPSRDEED